MQYCQLFLGHKQESKTIVFMNFSTNNLHNLEPNLELPINKIGIETNKY